MNLERLAVYIHEVCGLTTDRPVVVGVSGGADSLCVMDILHLLRYMVIVAHFDHQLRVDSAKEGNFIRDLCLQRGLACETGRTDVAALAEAQKLSIEEAARQARYTFLFATARQVGAQAVVTGHTADDQVETLLMHLLRGSGLNGLRGMLPRTTLPVWDAELPVTRPLLGVRRAETEAWCRERGLEFFMDPSNQDTTFFRNRLRHELIPVLEKYNPQARVLLAQTAQALAGDAEVVAQAVTAAWQACQGGCQGQRAWLTRAALLAQPVGVQRGLVRRAIEALRPGLRDLDFQTVERALAFARAPSRSGEADLALCVWVWIESDRLCFGDPEAAEALWPAIRGDASPVLAPGQTLDLGQGWRLSCSLPQPLAPDWRNEDAATAWIDAAVTPTPLRARIWEPGDRFSPLGMETGSQKLSDFFNGQRVPRRARAAWPLVVDASGGMVWVAGLRLAHTARVTEATRLALRLRLERYG